MRRFICLSTYRRCVLARDSARGRRLLLFCGRRAAEWWPGMSRTMADKAVVVEKQLKETPSKSCWTGTELIKAPKAGSSEGFTTSPEHGESEDAAELLHTAAERELRGRGNALVGKLMDMVMAGDLASGKLLNELLAHKATRKEKGDSPLWHLLKRWEEEPEWSGAPEDEATEVGAGDGDPEE